MTIPLGSIGHLVPPIYPASVYAIPDLDALDAIYAKTSPGFIYARDGHPNAQSLGQSLTRMEQGLWGHVTGSGMGALTAGLLGLVSQGERVLASDQLYGKTTKLLTTELARYGVETTLVDTCDLAAVEVALSRPARMLLVETISNPLCRVPDLSALVKYCHAAGVRVMVDNTFATPGLCRPLSLGADLVMESLTKLLGGHSDVTLGFLSGTNPQLGDSIGSMISTWGLAANPFDCWLTSRSLETFDLRLRAAMANAAALADWLAVQPGVRRVIYPGRAEHPDHAVASRTLSGGYGHMLTFELDDRAAVNQFLRAAPGIPFCPSLGHTSTTCSHPDSTSHRFVPTAEKQRLGIAPGLVRLSVGCEDLGSIQAELARGLR